MRSCSSRHRDEPGPILRRIATTGIAIGPIYASDASGEIVSRGNPGPWRIVQRIDLPDVDHALRQIEEDVAGGATGVELVFATSPSARGAGLPSNLGHGLDRLAGAPAAKRRRRAGRCRARRRRH